MSRQNNKKRSRGSNPKRKKRGTNPPRWNKKNRNNNNPLGNKQRTRQYSTPRAVGFTSTNIGNNSILITRSEPLFEMLATTDYVFKHYHINPGKKSLFAWLGGIACNYETYKFRKLNFRYVPTCSTDKSTVITMAIDYDASDNDQSLALKQILSFQGSVTGSCWKPLVCRANMKSMNTKPQFFVRSDSTAVTSDFKTYDCCQLVVATVNGDATSTGMIYCDYTIELITPQIIPNYYTVVGTSPMETSTPIATPFTNLPSDFFNDFPIKITKHSDSALKLFESFCGVISFLFKSSASMVSAGNLQAPSFPKGAYDASGFQRMMTAADHLSGRVDFAVDINDASETDPVIITWQGATAGTNLTNLEIILNAFDYPNVIKMIDMFA